MNTVSYSGMWWRKALSSAALVLAVSLVLQRPDAAAAAGTNCDALLEKAAKADEIPEIIIDSLTNSIRVRTSQGECVERLSAPTEPSAAPGPPQTALQAPPTAPAPPPAAAPVAEAPRPKPAAAAPKAAEPGKHFKTHSYFRPQPMPPPQSLGGPQGGTAKAPAPSPAADCTTDLNSLWKKGEHNIRGTTYWLSQVFTIDLDGDRRTDNVGFRLKAANTPELVIRYYAGPGDLAGRSVPTLRLDDEDVFSRLCFGQASFDKPRRKDRKTEPARAFETPDLEKEMMAKGNPALAVTQAERGGVVPNGLWVAIAAISGLVVASGGTGVYLTRRKWLPALKRAGKARRKDGEEEEEKEDEEEKEKEEKDEEEKDEDAKEKKQSPAGEDGAGEK